MKPRDSFATRPASPTVVCGLCPAGADIPAGPACRARGARSFRHTHLGYPLQAPGRRGGGRPGGGGRSTGPGPGGPWPQTPTPASGWRRHCARCCCAYWSAGRWPWPPPALVLVPGVPRARTAPVCPGPKCFIVYPKPGPPPGLAGSFHFPVSVLYGLAAGALVAAIVVLALSVMRRGRRPPPPELSALAEEYGEALEAALEGGRRALLGLDDARAAIIACYVAMEESLAQAGTTRSSAETPDELLARAASTLLVSAGAARRLTALFYEARFSSHPLDDDRRAEAESALSDLAAELSRAQAAAAGAEP